MTEYWVSKAKYYCTFCKCYMADNKASRQHHESGVKHKMNVENAVKQKRQDQLNGSRNEHELKLQLAQIERAAREAMSTDTSDLPSLLDQTGPKRSFNTSSQVSADEEKNTGIYTIKGVTYLDGKIFEDKLVKETICEIFLEELDEWCTGEILRRKETQIPHTNVTIKTFDVKYSVAITSEQFEELEERDIRSDRIRLVVNKQEYNESANNETVAGLLTSEPEPVPEIISEETGVGGWHTVSVVVVDEDKEREEYETAIEKAYNLNDQEEDIKIPEKIHTTKSLHPVAVLHSKEYKGFTIEDKPVSTISAVLAEGEVVEFKKRKLNEDSQQVKKKGGKNIRKREDDE